MWRILHLALESRADMASSSATAVGRHPCASEQTTSGEQQRGKRAGESGAPGPAVGHVDSLARRVVDASFE
ncbi:hypothetical protein, partial [Bacillus sp. SIMBA_033]|uniref:hypothetical protein n=1 Tax=Bacillus sp. SIMBA_033 TaxID=3085776 RepID=UPI0039784F75